MKKLLSVLFLIFFCLPQLATAGSAEYICRLAQAENNDFQLKVLNFSLTDTPSGPELVKNSVEAHAYPENIWTGSIKLVANHTQVTIVDAGTQIVGGDDSGLTSVVISISNPQPNNAFFGGEVDIYTKSSGARPMEAHLTCLKGQID